MKVTYGWRHGYIDVPARRWIELRIRQRLCSAERFVGKRVGFTVNLLAVAAAWSAGGIISCAREVTRHVLANCHRRLPAFEAGGLGYHRIPSLVQGPSSCGRVIRFGVVELAGGPRKCGSSVEAERV
jgi:hypothetical protein